jgi:hypothetical protein
MAVNVYVRLHPYHNLANCETGAILGNLAEAQFLMNRNQNLLSFSTNQDMGLCRSRQSSTKKRKTQPENCLRLGCKPTKWSRHVS